jgi:hypothetical protein
MRKSSWIVLGISVALVVCLGCAYLLTRSTPETLTKEQAAQIIKEMQEAVRHKNVNAIMAYVSPDPDTKVAGLDQEHMRRLLVGALHRMDDPRADVANLVFAGGTDDATISCDVAVHNDGPNQSIVDYIGHVTLQLKRVDVAHLFGLYHTKEWRIVGGTQDGPDVTGWGDD